jgi:hypothetical protein
MLLNRFPVTFSFSGWIVKYTNSDNSAPIFMAEGLMGKRNATPSTLWVTSGGGQQSVLWVGKVGSLEVKTVTHLSDNKLYFTTSVVIKNTATTEIRKLYCKCLM